jgi:hypothetical protein
MKLVIHLPKGMTAGQLSEVVREALREQERIRQERRRLDDRQDREATARSHG